MYVGWQEKIKVCVKMAAGNVAQKPLRAQGRFVSAKRSRINTLIFINPAAGIYFTFWNPIMESASNRI